FASIATLFLQLPGSSLLAPVWLQERLENWIAQTYPQLDVGFESLALVVDEDWSANIAFQDVALRDTNQLSSLSFPNLKLTLSPTALLSGKFRPTTVRLSGAFVTLRRDEGGRFNLALSKSQQTRNLATLLNTVDGALKRPALAEFEQFLLTDLSVRYDDDRAGRSWNVDGGRLQLELSGAALQLAADFTVVGNRSDAASMSINASSIIGSSEITLGIKFEDMPAADLALQSPALAWLAVLKAPISGAVRTGFDAAGTLLPLNASLRIGAGILQPNKNTRAIPFERASGYFSYDPVSHRLTFDSISLKSGVITTEATGHASLLGPVGGLPKGLLGQFELSEIITKPFPDLATEVKFDKVAMDFKLTFDPLDVHLGRLALLMPEGEILLDGTATAQADGWNWGLNMSLPAATPAQVLGYWPTKLKPKLRGWIETNIETGELRDITFALRSTPGLSLRSHLGFVFEKARIRYLKTLPKLEEAAGYATLTDTRFVATVESGWVKSKQGGRIMAAGTTFVIPNTRVKPAPAEVDLIASGSLAAALSVLDEPPFRFISKAKLLTETIRGNADVKAKFTFVLKKKLPRNEIKFQALGQITRFGSEALIPKHSLKSQKLTVVVDNRGMSLSGSGFLDTSAFDGTWQMQFGKDRNTDSYFDGSIEVSPALLESFAIALPPDTVTDVGRGEVRLLLPKGAPPKLEFQTDLAGIGVNIPQIGWRKKPAQTGKLVFSATLSSPIDVHQITFAANGLKAIGNLGLTAEGKFERLDLSTLEIGGWLKSPVSLIGRGAAQAPEIIVTGGTMDLRKLPQTGSRKGRNGPINLSLKRLQVSNGIALDHFKAKFSPGIGLNGTFSGLVNRRAPVIGRVSPRDGRSAVLLRSNDAGKVLEAAGLFRKVSGGALELTLEPHGTAGTFDGVLKVINSRLRDAPVMAELLNIISVVGLLEQLGKSGILFTEVDAKFRLTPDQVIVSQSSAIGPSIGVSLDGYYDLGTRGMDMQGVLSPIYLFNGIASILGRKGEGLIGFNFSLKGNADRPRVLVNP
ncbi:MAG: DUF3971 domain-containing protein, partial [Paracoccaceae bacterium]|nr:DUF3971 domain-containing protein [Paracoccaceae bacterium]